MSRKVFALFGVIGLEGAEKVFTQLNAIDKKAKLLSRQLMKTGRQFERLGKGVTKSVTVPLAIAGAAVLKFGGDFEKAMTTSLAIMGNVSDKMKKQMSDTAREMSKKTTQSATQLAEAYFFLASAGYDAAKSINALPIVTRFATAGQFEMSLATDLLTDALSALGLAVEDTAQNEANLIEVSDVLVKANTLANASVQQFSESLTNRAGAALKILGKTVQEGVAVLAAYADQGVKGAEAGTQLGIVLRDLQKAAINNGKAFKNNKINVFDAAGEMRNMADVIGDLENGLEGMSDKQKKATLSTLGFQEKSIASLLTLIGTSEKIRDYEKALSSAAGTTEEVSKKQLQNFNDQLAMVKNRLIDVGISLSMDLLPVIKNRVIPAVEGFVEKIQGMIDGFRNLDPFVKSMILKFVGFVAVAGPVLLIMGKMITLVAGLTFQIKLLTAVLFGNPFVIATVAIVALGTAVFKATKRFRELNKVTDATVKHLGKVNDAAEYSTAVAKAMREEWEKDPNFDSSKFRKEFKERWDLYNKAGENSYSKLQETREAYEEKEKVAVKKLLNEKIRLEELAAKLKKEKLDEADNIKKEEIELEQKNTDTILRLVQQRMDKYRQKAKYRMQLTQDIKDWEAELSKTQREKDQAEDQKAADAMYNMQLSYLERLAEKKKYFASLAIESMNQVFSIFSGINQNRSITLDNYHKSEQQKIDESADSDEEKARQTEELDEKVAKKKAVLARKAAALEKVAAIFSIGVSTAQAIMAAWASKLPTAAKIAQTVFVSALGIAQQAVVAAKPLPKLAKGAVVRNTVGGVDVTVAEAGQDEMIMPLKTGIDAIVKGLSEKISGLSLPNLSGNNSGSGKAPVHLHIGTLVADRMGLKKLERTLSEFRFSEAERVMA